MSLSQLPLAKSAFILACLFLTACSNIDLQTQADDVSIEIENQTNLVIYRCEQDELLAYFHGNRAELKWQAKSYYLTQVVSTSGVRYFGESLSFWAHNQDAELELDTGDKVNCRLVKVES
ncbi:MliC family protein [Marinomonas sp. THO17]|uniref:MliC family protein n=1 Tax=Marinomonas sp. THO17 TaxID=3149048 RepID=UPI00336BF927